tara:strand:- start:7709 stop:8572 length:864 start_codon:yes stop_codon:yes gene_type:complete
MKNNSSLSHRNQEPESGVCYVVGTPIGNLSDLSPRAMNILENVSFVACEDTRQTKKIMSKFNISNYLISLNKHNSLTKLPKLLNDLKKGKSIAIVSDAGMPSICDPGEDVIKIFRSNGIDVICIPGPCAAITAIVSSGMPCSSFIFEGFLSKKKKERENTLLEISKSEKTTVLFESPHRLKKLLNELKEFCGEEREIMVFRELTKIYEEHIGHNINMALEFFEKTEVKGEITIVIKGISKANNSEIETSQLKKELYELVKAGLSLSAASKYLAKKKNLPKNIIYNLY